MSRASSILNLLFLFLFLQHFRQETARQRILVVDDHFGRAFGDDLAAFIGGSGVFLLIESAGRIVNPQPVRHGLVGIGVMVLSIAATVLLVGYQRHVVRQTRSTAIQADSIHYAADTLVNGSVILSVFS